MENEHILTIGVHCLQRATLKKQLETTRNQKEKLETLCRTLQTERKQYKLALSNAVSSPSESDPDAATQA